MYYQTFEEIQRMNEFVENMECYFKDTFCQYSRSLVRNVVYIESISGYEESFGIAIYQDWNGFFYIVHFGHCVMGDNENYTYQQITEEQAIQEMIEMDNSLLEKN